MNLKIKKQLPKIVLAQSLACTAILANGLYNNRNNTVSAEVTAAEEYIHAIEVLGGEKVSEEEQEKIKQLFQRDTVKKTFRIRRKVLSVSTEDKGFEFRRKQSKRHRKRTTSFKLGLFEG